jgi:hypothetical protein
MQDFIITLQPVIYSGVAPNGSVLAQATITTTQACNKVVVSQVGSLPIKFVVIDAANPNSPIAVKAGGSYPFSNGGAGYGSNVNVGTIQVTDTDFPTGDGTRNQFSIAQR